MIIYSIFFLLFFHLTLYNILKMRYHVSVIIFLLLVDCKEEQNP